MKSEVSPCPVCGSPFYTATFPGRWLPGKVWYVPPSPLLYICEGGCPGRSIAAALGRKLPGPEGEPQPAQPLRFPGGVAEPAARDASDALPSTRVA